MFARLKVWGANTSTSCFGKREEYRPSVDVAAVKSYSGNPRIESA